MADADGPPPAVANALKQAHMAQMRLQAAIDKTTPYAARRWAATTGLLVLFMLRIVLAQGWYIGALSPARQTRGIRLRQMSSLARDTS